MMILDCCIAYEFGLDYKATAKKYRRQLSGVMKQHIIKIEHADKAAMERVSKTMVEHLM